VIRALRVLTIASTLLPSLIAQPAAADQFLLLTGAREPYSNAEQTGFLDRIAHEAFARLGHSAEVEILPPARAIETVNKGEADGDMQRIPGLEAEFPNLVMVPEPVNTYEFTGFMAADSAPNDISRLRDLSGRTVSYLHGWKFYELNLPPGANAIVVNRPVQMFELIRSGRVEIALFSRWSAHYWARKLNMKIRVLAPPFKSLDMYIYLNRRHRGLVADLADTLRTMKRDGSYQKIRATTLERLSRP